MGSWRKSDDAALGHEPFHGEGPEDAPQQQLLLRVLKQPHDRSGQRMRRALSQLCSAAQSFECGVMLLSNEAAWRLRLICCRQQAAVLKAAQRARPWLCGLLGTCIGIGREQLDDVPDVAALRRLHKQHPALLKVACAAQHGCQGAE